MNHGQITLTIVGIYLPFFSGTSFENYNETLDKIHAIIETLDSPVMLVGDMNAQLPQQQVLPVNWYRQRPFNKHSVFLHDFLCDHKMILANFHYKQNIKYTYFSGSSRSYIDHICVSENAIKKVTECIILPHHVDNVGDHLPVKVIIKLQCMPSSNEHNNDFRDDVMCKNINNIDWSKVTIRKQYLVNLKKYTTDINNLSHIRTITDDKAAQLCVNAHGGLAPLKWQRTGSRYGMTFGLPVINHVTASLRYTYIYAINLPKPSIGKLVVLHLMNV